MPKPNVPRPKPLQIDQIRHEPEETPNESITDFFNRRQIVGNLNPDDLQTLSELGSGNGGFVTKVKHVPSNQILARKIIRVEVNATERSRIMQELEVLKDCNSPYIVGYFGACHKNGEINLFMEYMDGRSLDWLLTRTRRINEEIIGKITTSVIQGLVYLKDRLNIMHRDIKPSNILVNSDGHIKICDFGVSGHLIDSIAQSFVGTKQYMAPERLLGSNYTTSSDIWSLGITLIELALGMYPIPQHDPVRMYEGEASPEASRMPIFALMECIVNEPPPTIPGPPLFSAEFKDFVDCCLKKSPSHRFDLRTILQHAFVTKSDQMHVNVSLWVCHVCSNALPEQHQTQRNLQHSPQVLTPDHQPPTPDN